VELRDLRVALRRHWFAAAAAFLVCMLVGVYVAYSANKTYEATATLSVQPNPTVSGGGQGGVQAANFIIPTVVAELKSSPYRGLASDALPDQYANRRVKVSAHVETGTGIVKVSVEADNPQTAINWANALATVAANDPTRATGFVSVKIIEPATHATAATGGDKTALLIASAVLGVLAAVFVALIASRTRRALDPTVEARARLHLPVLATIPRVRALRKRPLRPLMTSKSIPDLEESFRQLRTAIELTFVRERPDVIAVTSFVAGEGKTTVTVGLAVALASVGHDVVLLDADLRRPAVHTALGVPLGTEGLADWSRRDRHPELRRSEVEQLGYLTAGTPDRHPADVTALALSRALTAYRQPGRLLLLDAPPIRGAAETPLVLAAASHVIVVVDASSSKMPELASTLEEFRARGVSFLGVVVNKAKKHRRDKNDEYAYLVPRVQTHTNGSVTNPPAPAPAPRPPNPARPN
jgi:Mrp family chromosome partitioning ATPase